MSVESERIALELFAQALDLPVGEREAWLRGAAGSPEVLAILLRMLAVESPSRAIEQKSQGESLLAALRLEGRVLDDYRLVREIGGGAVGRVFEAEQLSLRRTVAVKVLRLEHCQNEEMLHRFRQEPEYQARLQHANIVKVISTGACDGWHYFAMEYIRGPSLTQLLVPVGDVQREGVALDLTSTRTCVELVEKIALALHYAHTQGIVHRDIKPHNILIDRSGEPLLSDFGLARAIDREALTGSLGDGLHGTLSYMSPEQAQDFHTADPRADVYSLGAVLYQLLTRTLPFEAETAVELLNKILSPEAHVRPPHHFLRGFDRRLSSICTKALEKVPSARFATALELAECLRAQLDGRRVDCRPVSRLRQVGERRRSTRALLGGAALVSSLALAVVVGARVARAAGEVAPSLVLDLPEDSTVGVMEICAPDNHLREARRMEHVSGELSLVVPDGVYRISITSAGAFAELQRELSVRNPIRLAPILRSTEEASSSMALVPAGRVKTSLSRETVSAQHDAFWIDRAPVTNREFREFLVATGQWPLREWTPAWLDVWEGVGPTPRPANWDELPVVCVPWRQAREYAEWKGKRLPTLFEWSAALGLADEVPPATWEQWSKRFAFGRPQFVWQENGRPSTPLAYLEQVGPARGSEEDAFGPHGLWSVFGSVDQWLETVEFSRGEANEWLSGTHYTAHGAWHFSPPAEPLFSARQGAAGDQGFRCAKSARPGGS